jgi:excinuclease ABC subunit A
MAENTPQYIKIRGAREHNLKNIDVDIPKNKLVVFTGLSGSGKSSLAFDTIYAEGQRRYVESLSAYARQFLGVMDKPDVDSIDGLSPAISIDQKSASHNPRSTVGTVTEIYDYLRLLFARVGHPHCPICGREIAQQSSQQIIQAALSQIQMTLKEKLIVKFAILSPVIRDRKGEFTELFSNLRSKGYIRVRIDNQFFDLIDTPTLIKTNKHSVDVVVDRLSLERSQLKTDQQIASFKTRLADSIENALKLSQGLIILAQIDDKGFNFPEKPSLVKDNLFSQNYACPVDNLSLPEIEPRIFSFNSPHGACPNCSGLGTILTIEPDRVLAPEITIMQGGIIPYASMIERDGWFARILKTVCQENGISLNTPIKNLHQDKLKILLWGTGERLYDVTGENRFGRTTTITQEFEGIVNNLERRYRETDSEFIRFEIQRYMREKICDVCHGSRLKPEALSVTVDQKSIVDVTAMNIANAIEWVTQLEKPLVLSDRETKIAQLILREIKSRLKFLLTVGLDYLTLARPAGSLSGGESKRIRLASQVGTGLTGVLYTLDEPSIGLHQRDNERLIETLLQLRDLGNSVIVVEHDQEIMERSDWIIDFGPAAGEHGGRIVAQGTLDQIKKSPNSLTGAYLSGRKSIRIEKDPSLSLNISYSVNGQITLAGAKGNNLKNLNVSFPLGKLISVTGVSGSGKSTLVVDTLYHAIAQSLFADHHESPLPYESLKGIEQIKRVSLIDQSPIGRTPRSNPVTYTGVFTFIRDIFARTSEARIRGYLPGRFSFNVRGGRCDACQGEGQTKIQMQFLPDVYVNCEVCGGKRFNEETLEVRFKEKNIAEILGMTVEEALSFFTNIAGLESGLQTLSDVGLGYIHLGQPAPTLSGGEAQRVKLASELGKKTHGQTLYVLDEPTTGLHFADLERLLVVLRRLVDMGNTVIVIEHNLDVVKNSDWVIDLGPDGGDRGGQLIASGTPWDIVRQKKSYTGQYLKGVLR